ncbi:purple acid phosphatase 3-like [Olea europaea subsp. europaea]|uniref:Purple acid phosphatase n=1 Tax=Olea europaea subsp. europaea TaxID=158383 RepID=A0A8S0U726_OLEEU|nr:purple acid phosphatase 3-like [Olea europaea subsp. europaea]
MYCANIKVKDAQQGKQPSYLSYFSPHPSSYGTVVVPTGPIPTHPMAVKNEIFIVICVIVGTIVIIGGNAELQRFDHPAKADGSLSILVVGDWGRKGKYNQSQVASQMGITGEKMDLDFIISTGDNFYPSGLTGEHDTAFEESFTKIYTAPSLQRLWYSVLGNHDYRGDALAQLSPILKQRDGKWFCLKSYILSTDIAEFFFIDTTPFQDKYFTDPGDKVYDWRGVLPREKYLTTILRDLESALGESHAKWKIVVGHHTIRSGGIHGDTQELVKRLLPILKASNVDMYINGHDHCLEHISSGDSPLQFFTSGGGSKAWRGNYSWSSNEKDQMKFYYDGQGFMTMRITQNEVGIDFYDIVGNILHKWSASKSLFSII